MHKVEDCPGINFTGTFVLYGVTYRRDTTYRHLLIELDADGQPTGGRQTVRAIEQNQREQHTAQQMAARQAAQRNSK